MLNLTKSILATSLATIVSLPVLAEEDCSKTLTCQGKWDGSVEFGYVALTGNKDSDSLNSRLAASYEVERWRHSGFLSLVTSSTEETTNNEVVKTDTRKLTAQAKTDYKYSDKLYIFGILDYDDTDDSGFEYQTSFAAGLGYNFIKDDVHTLDGEIGFGRRTSKIEATDTSPSDTNNESIWRLAGKYTWKISETAQFEQQLSTEIGDDNTISRSYSGLSANIIDSLALKLSYTLKHQSDVPAGNEKDETITAFTVVYSF